jgi:hypothetical protein
MLLSWRSIKHDQVFKSIVGNELDDISHFRYVIAEYRLAKGRNITMEE